MWKYLGIFDLIQLSRVHLKYNPTMLLTGTCFWESANNTLHLPCGMLTPTLFYLAAIIGFRPMGKLMNRSGLHGPTLLLISPMCILIFSFGLAVVRLKILMLTSIYLS